MNNISKYAVKVMVNNNARRKAKYVINLSLYLPNIGQKSLNVNDSAPDERFNQLEIGGSRDKEAAIKSKKDEYDIFPSMREPARAEKRKNVPVVQSGSLMPESFISQKFEDMLNQLELESKTNQEPQLEVEKNDELSKALRETEELFNGAMEASKPSEQTRKLEHVEKIDKLNLQNESNSNALEEKDELADAMRYFEDMLEEAKEAVKVDKSEQDYEEFDKILEQLKLESSVEAPETEKPDEDQKLQKLFEQLELEATSAAESHLDGGKKDKRCYTTLNEWFNQLEIGGSCDKEADIKPKKDEYDIFPSMREPAHAEKREKVPVVQSGGLMTESFISQKFDDVLNQLELESKTNPEPQLETETNEELSVALRECEQLFNGAMEASKPSEKAQKLELDEMIYQLNLQSPESFISQEFDDVLNHLELESKTNPELQLEVETNDELSEALRECEQLFNGAMEASKPSEQAQKLELDEMIGQLNLQSPESFISQRLDDVLNYLELESKTNPEPHLEVDTNDELSVALRECEELLNGAMEANKPSEQARRLELDGMIDQLNLQSESNSNAPEEKDKLDDAMRDYEEMLEEAKEAVEVDKSEQRYEEFDEILEQLKLESSVEAPETEKSDEDQKLQELLEQLQLEAKSTVESRLDDGKEDEQCDTVRDWDEMLEEAKEAMKTDDLDEQEFDELEQRELEASYETTEIHMTGDDMKLDEHLKQLELKAKTEAKDQLEAEKKGELDDVTDETRR